jgi:hypothetical protein
MDLLPLKAMAEARIMTTTSIRTLRSNVSQTDALRKFSSIGLATLYRRVRIGPLRRIAAVYVPFFVYRVTYQLGRAPRTRCFAIDAVEGSLDLFEFPGVPVDSQLVDIQTRNCLPPVLSDKRAEQLLGDKVLRVIFQQGFFKLRESNLAIARESIDLYLPYWLAFYGDKTTRCRVMDAVRRRIEGAKACAFFEQWLAA